METLSTGLVTGNEEERRKTVELMGICAYELGSKSTGLENARLLLNSARLTTREAKDGQRMTPETKNTPPALAEHSVPFLPEKTRARAEARNSKGHFYKPLPTRIRRNGFDYCQIAREGDAAIYEQTWRGRADPSPCYEVIRIKRRAGFVVDGRVVEPAEVYPPTERWGADGLTFINRDKASSKFFEISALKEV
jgi:hypothetical protein